MGILPLIVMNPLLSNSVLSCLIILYAFVLEIDNSVTTSSTSYNTFCLFDNIAPPKLIVNPFYLIGPILVLQFSNFLNLFQHIFCMNFLSF